VGAYALVLSETATATLATASRGEQRKLLDILQGLKAAPFRPTALQERAADGRANQVLLVQDWLLTYWLDHAACEIRLIRLEQIESKRA
jgi:hypothetical protein